MVLSLFWVRVRAGCHAKRHASLSLLRWARCRHVSEQNLELDRWGW